MLQSMTSSLKRGRTDRPSGAYRQGPSTHPDATALLRKRTRKSAPPATTPLTASQHRDLLRESLQQALQGRRYHDALHTILGLIALDPTDPRWPHKYGDVLRSLRRENEAAAAYRRAARRYDAAGFPVRAAAMMRLARELEGDSGPRRREDLEQSPRLRSDVTAPITRDPHAS